MRFEIREARAPQGKKKLDRERAAYFQLMAQGYSSFEACRIVGVNTRTGKRWRNGTPPSADRPAGRPAHRIGAAWATCSNPAPVFRRTPMDCLAHAVIDGALSD